MSGRRIAPRPADAATSPAPAADADAPSPAPALAEALAPSSASSSQTQITARKKVTSACQGCQRRRVKCDGNQPCSTCARTKTECSYTRELDGRSIKRKYHEVQRDQDLLNALLETIRHSRDEHVSQIIALIRSAASVDDVKACVTQMVIENSLAGGERSPDFKQLQTGLEQCKSKADHRTRTQQRSDVLEIQRLADNPLHKLPASPWTTVTDDDDLVSNLISVWLTWDKGWNDWIDEDLFVRDMKTGSLDATFCSPFLVNCILAWACPYTDYREARTSNGTVSQLMHDFVAEAKHLLDNESTPVLDVTTVQGLMFLHATNAVLGKGQHGYRYMLQTIGMVGDLMASAAAAKPHPDPQAAREMAYSIDRTGWGLYIVTTQTLIGYLKPQTMKIPRRSRPGRGLGGLNYRLWRPYPQSDVPIPSYRDELFEWACDLAILEAELSQILFDAEEQRSRQEQESQLFKLYKDMEQKLKQLPREFDVKLGSCPTLLTNQIRIQTICLRIFSALRGEVPYSSSDIAAFARVKCVEAAVEIARICKLYMDSWGSSFLGVICSSGFVISLSVLLEQPDNVAYSSQIIDLCVAVRAMCRRWPICMAMLRTIQLDARTHGWRLPSETDKLFEEFEGSAWKHREMKKFATMWPTVEAHKAASPAVDDIQMGKFLEMMELLELGNEEPDQEDATT